MEPAPPSAPDTGDRELVARATSDPDAFDALYRRHYPAIARYVRRRVGDEGVPRAPVRARRHPEDHFFGEEISAEPLAIGYGDLSDGEVNPPPFTLKPRRG